MSVNEFIKNLLSDSNEVSSKRVISLLSFVLYFFIILYSIVNQQEINDVIIYSLVSLIIGQSIMTLASSKSASTTTPKQPVQPPQPIQQPVYHQAQFDEIEKMPDGI